jgi:hypothetical protein
VEDLAKKRREYLREKAVGSILIVVAVFFCAPLAVSTLFSFIGLVIVRERAENVVQVIVLFISCPLLIWMARTAGKINTKINSLEYVPPVAEQIKDLPAEEILVRGSDQPAATRDELLRAANEAQDTGSEELLRANIVQSAQDQRAKIIVE